MLLISLIYFIRSQNHYDLTNPFRWSSPYLINNWALYGITNLRESLKFDQDNSRNLSAACNLIFYNNSDFDVIIQLSVTSGLFYFIYSTEDCPISYFYNHDKYSLSDGFLLKFTKSNASKTEVYINFFNHGAIDNLKLIKIGDFSENSESDEKNGIIKNAISLRLKKNSNQFSILRFDSQSNLDNWKSIKVFNEKISNIGYFSFFGTPSSEAGDQILYSFEVKDSLKIQPNLQNNTINKNLKIFKSKLGIYYEKKKQLLYSTKVSINETLNDNKNQNKINEETTKLIFHILSEITERAKLGLNDTEFENLLELSAIMKLLRSEKKISKRRAVLDEIGKHIDDIKTSLLNNLTNLTKNVSDEMNNIEEIGFEILKKFMPKLWEGNIVVNEVIKIKKESKKEYPLNLILLVISAIETILFVIFFIYKRHSTKDFRKID